MSALFGEEREPFFAFAGCVRRFDVRACSRERSDFPPSLGGKSPPRLDKDENTEEEEEHEVEQLVVLP